MRGPIDFIIVGFEKPKFDGSILQKLGDALDQGIIGLIALSVVTKDSDGVVDTVNLADFGDSYLIEFEEKYGGDSDLISEEDVDEVADLLQNDTAVALLVVEHLWAKPLKEAILNANGVLIADGRIHPDAALELDKA